MWVMTPTGYTSAVAHRTKPSCVLVRARDKESLEFMCDRAGIKRDRIFTDFPSDYPYRAVVKRKQYARFLLHSAEEITYENFKNQATKVRGKQYHDVLMKIWTVTHGLTPSDIKLKNACAWDEYDRKRGLGKYAAMAKGKVRSVRSYYHNTPKTDERKEDEPDADYVEWWATQHGYDADEVEELVEDVDALLPKTKSVHDMTEDEWRLLMEQNPAGI
jgi:hypothetical protein